MTLKTYHTLFIVFLVITIILFILLVALFFMLDIRKIISIKTGWAVKQSTRELYKINQKEDNKKRKTYKGKSIPLYKKQDDNTFIRESDNMNNRSGNKQFNSSNEEASKSDVSVTVKLGQAAKETVPLTIFTKTGVLQTISDSKNEGQEDEIFNIVETKIVMFSDEIIARGNE